MDRPVFSFFHSEGMATYPPAIPPGVVVTLELAGGDRVARPGARPRPPAGFVVPVKLAVVIVVTGLALGLVLAVVRAFQVKPVNALIVVFVDLARALPPLVIIILFYFALPAVGVRMSGFAATWLSLSLVL